MNDLGDIYHEQQDDLSPKEQLEAAMLDEFKRSHPNLPEYAYPKPKKSKSPANELTADIIKHIKLMHGWSTRVNTMGRVLDGKYIPGSTERGTPDIIGCIKGRFVSIEVKINDKQSPDQKEVERKIKAANGYYFVCHNLDEWFECYKTIIYILIFVLLTSCATQKWNGVNKGESVRVIYDRGVDYKTK